MANPERGEVRLPVNGQDYTLKLTTNLIASIEEHSGKTLGKLLEEASDLGVGSIRWLVWGLLQKYHAPQFAKVEQVGDFIDEAGGVPQFVDAINKIVKLNTADPSSGNGHGANPPTPGTGIDSTSKADVSG